MQPEYIKVIECRVCHSKNILDLGIKKNFFLLNLNQTVTLSYGICSNCHFIFHNEYVGDAFLTHYYQQSPMLRRKESSPEEKSQYQRQAGFLSRYIDLKQSKILEIGAHTGNFLVHLKEKYNCDPYFDELSEEAKKILLEQPGLRDYRAGQSTKIDVVILRHVLEHIFDLDGFLSYVKSILSQHGTLFIEVPDWSAFDDHTDPLIFEHLNQFNSFNLTLLLKRNGFSCETMEKSIIADDPATPNRVVRILAKRSAVSELGSPKIVDDVQQFYAANYDYVNKAVNALVAKLGSQKTVALYPASHQTFMTLYESDLIKANIIGMFDIDAKKHGKKVRGIEIFPSEKLKEVQPDVILLLTFGAFAFEIIKYFKSMGLKADVITLNQILGREASPDVALTT